MAFFSASLLLTACKKDEEANSCLELPSTASFTVNGTTYSEMTVLAWSNNGIYQTFRFRTENTNDELEAVAFVFEGDTVGNYPLGETSSPHYASYSGPVSNFNILSSGPGETGLLTISEFDTVTRCISGNYTYTANFVQVSGEFKNLKPID